MGIIRDRANVTYRDGPASNPHHPEKGGGDGIRELFGVIEDAIEGVDTDVDAKVDAERQAREQAIADEASARQQADADLADQIEGAAEGTVLASTWAELDATPGTRAGQQGSVPNSDAGTHTDPVTSETVDNAGIYRWSDSPTGWKWVDVYQDLSNVAHLNDDGSLSVTGLSVPGGGFAPFPFDGWLFVVWDGPDQGNVLWGIRDDGSTTGGSDEEVPIDHAVAWAVAEAYGDPTESLAITWRSTSAARKVIEYRVTGGIGWQSASSIRSQQIPYLGDYLHTAILRGLSAGASYDLRWPGAAETDKVYTARRDGVRVAHVSDNHWIITQSASRTAQLGVVFDAEKPDLIVLGGDLAHDDGIKDASTYGLWNDFLAAISSHWRSNDALIPMVLTCGNHEGAGSTSAGLGTWGPMPEFAFGGFDAEQPYQARLRHGVQVVTIGREIAIVTIDTAHMATLESQIDWLTETLDTVMPNVRHGIVVGHAPAFNFAADYNFETIDAQARYLRNFIWPVLCEHAPKLRYYATGHEHVIAATARLTTHYDAGESAIDNDRRWMTPGDGSGVRQIGSGPSGGNCFRGSLEKAEQTSLLDESPKAIAHLGTDGASGFVAMGDITNPTANFINAWISDFDADGMTTRCVGLSGQEFCRIEE